MQLGPWSPKSEEHERAKKKIKDATWDLDPKKERENKRKIKEMEDATDLEPKKQRKI